MRGETQGTTVAFPTQCSGSCLITSREFKEMIKNNWTKAASLRLKEEKKPLEGEEMFAEVNEESNRQRTGLGWRKDG